MTTRVLRIDFQVREVELGDDGRALPAKSDDRYITFGDNVMAPGIDDFFERCRLSARYLFHDLVGPVVLVFRVAPMNKIAAIKVVRELTGIGLKEAKDLVEAPLGTPLCVFKDENVGKRKLAYLETVAGGKADLIAGAEHVLSSCPVFREAP